MNKIGTSEEVTLEILGWNVKVSGFDVSLGIGAEIEFLVTVEKMVVGEVKPLEFHGFGNLSLPSLEIGEDTSWSEILKLCSGEFSAEVHRVFFEILRKEVSGVGEHLAQEEHIRRVLRRMELKREIREEFRELLRSHERLHLGIDSGTGI